MNKFTFVIPVYNAEAYLRDCLDSLKNQDYPNWEAICVDDGSTDKSLQILSDYSAKDERMKIISQTNQGVSSARNRALAEVEPCANNWVVFLDSDDFISSNMLSSLNSVILDVNGRVEYIKTKCKMLIYRILSHPPPHTSTVTPITHIPPTSSKSQYLSLTRSGYFRNGEVGGFIASVVLRADFLINSGIRFPSDMKILEDQLFSLRLALLAENFIVMKTPYYFYYQSQQSQGTKNFNVDDINKCVNSIWNELRDVSDKDILSYFHKKYFPTKMAMIKQSGHSDIILDPEIEFGKFLMRYYLNELIKLPGRVCRHIFRSR